MAICREHHKPDFFITMTCNQHWDEITKELRKGESAKDRPDLVARVFKQKKDQLIKDIYSSKIFGKVPAYLWVIEFQKRGLPHAHILLIRQHSDQPQTPDDVGMMKVQNCRIHVTQNKQNSCEFFCLHRYTALVVSAIRMLRAW